MKASPLLALALFLSIQAVRAEPSATWSPPLELSTASTRDARDLVIDANGLGDFVAA